VPPDHSLSCGERATAGSSTERWTVKSKRASIGLASSFALSMFALSLPAVAQFSFSNAVDYPSGGIPRDVAVADLDGDGDLDLASTLLLPPRLAVLRNNGNGTYAAAEFTDLASNVVPQALIAADLDGDLLADIALVSGSGELVLLLNSQDAGFLPFANVFVGEGPTELAAADMDGDGDLDFAVSLTRRDAVAIVHDLGTDGFQKVQEVTVGGVPKALAFGRFFRHGMDLAVAVHGASAVAVLFNDGRGRYSVSETLQLAAGNAPECVAVADFDEDALDDLAVTYSEGLVNKFAVFYQIDVGMTDPITIFSPPHVFNVGARHPTHIVTGDFDLDRRVDVAVVSSETSALSVLRNLGNRTFGFQTMVTLPGPLADHMAAADLDADYLVDLVCTNGSGDLSVVLNALSNPWTYCFAVPNSTLVGAEIGMQGSTSIANGDLQLRVDNLPPSAPGTFLMAPKPAQTPFEGSFLCLAPPVFRMSQAVVANSRGVVSDAFWSDKNSSLALAPGTVVNFQLMYRDSRNVSWPRTNFSNGLRVVFEP
jgi:hypothetical protein